MDLSSYLAFCLIAAAQTAGPGPSTLFLVNNALALGWRRALFALTGDLAAIALLATLAILGLGALLAAYPPLAFLGLRLLGASYVIWLGVGYLRALAPQPDVAPGTPGAQDGMALWLRGFGVGLSNPKAVLFFAALFPQFIPADSGTFILVLLVATFVAVKLVVLGGYALGAQRIARLFRNPRAARRGRMLTGLFFIALGALMIWSALTAP